MTKWKKFSPLVELNRDTPLSEVQDLLVAGGNVLQDLLTAVHPDASAVLTAVESIKRQLDEEGISGYRPCPCWRRERTHLEHYRLSGKLVYILYSSFILDVHML